MSHQLSIVYFAWVKERLGREQDVIEYPKNVTTVGELLKHLQSRDAASNEVFADRTKLRFALDQDFVGLDAVIGSATELAIFPPVTGG
ncbi:molybdopterin converting factor subunit 1 [Parasphingorhabdus litoris]|uniref:Molybdopterin converting factor subunit 1 n=1 Tax=Parasphingorhabdus litoris TaxID=394733 RepID=A0ABP3K5S7_9SPHN|nr:molybdopterin converting factor subunit 1 [Parasphingorhabdus litoris]